MKFQEGFLEKMSQDKKFTLKPTLTPSNLPVLTKAVKEAFVEEMERDFSERNYSIKILTERYKKINKENPQMFDAIREMVRCFPSYIQFSVAVALTNEYLLFESQGNRDKIYEYFSKAEK